MKEINEIEIDVYSELLEESTTAGGSGGCFALLCIQAGISESEIRHLVLESVSEAFSATLLSQKLIAIYH